MKKRKGEKDKCEEVGRQKNEKIFIQRKGETEKWKIKEEKEGNLGDKKTVKEE